MSKYPRKETTVTEIVDYWAQRIDECGLPIDWADAHDHCWRCATQKDTSRLQRCHIIPASLSGPDEPSNYVLLCARCHKEAPDASDPIVMWRWIRASVELVNRYLGLGGDYGVYWMARSAEEYERLFGRRFDADIQSLTGSSDEFLQEYSRILRTSTTWHFGDSGLNPATCATAMFKALTSVNQRRRAQ